MSYQPPYNPSYSSPYPAGMVPQGGQYAAYPATAYPAGAYPAYPQQAVGAVPTGYPAYAAQNYTPAAYPAGGYGQPAGAIYPQIPHYNDSRQWPVGMVQGYVLEPTEEELKHMRMEIKYSPAKDKYVRVTDQNREIPGWKSLVYSEQNMIHKIESDWKMAYLARQPGTDLARIEWRFDLTRFGKKVKELHIQFPTKLYEDGYVNAFVLGNGAHINLKSSDKSQELNSAKGLEKFSLIAELSHGKKDVAWQHAQLFRQHTEPGFFSTDNDLFPFKVWVYFY